MSKTLFKIKIEQELLRNKRRVPIKPSKRMKDKTKYNRKAKHKK